MVISVEDTLVSDEYDEFGLLHENAAEWDIPFSGQPAVSRHRFALPSGREISYLRWGEGEPELVLLHGLGQCAHTWDTVILALGRPAIAVDLPGHGLSDWRSDCDYGPWQNAEAVALLMESVAPLGPRCSRHLPGWWCHDHPSGGAIPQPVPPRRLRGHHPSAQRSHAHLHAVRARRQTAHVRLVRLRHLRRDGRRHGRPQPALLVKPASDARSATPAAGSTTAAGRGAATPSYAVRAGAWPRTRGGTRPAAATRPTSHRCGATSATPRGARALRPGELSPPVRG